MRSTNILVQLPCTVTHALYIKKISEMETPSAIAPSEPSPQPSSSPVNALKRRRSSETEVQRDNDSNDSKRQRVNGSNGKQAPAHENSSEHNEVARAEDERPRSSHSDAVHDPPHPPNVRDRRKPSVADEKLRSKRLFGALLGNLNQPSDTKQSSRRAEIEARRKSEIKKQDEEDLARDARERERRLEWRRRRQSAVEEEQMKVRHRNFLERAHFLSTEAEPRLYYKPWELRAEEEERIEEQIREAEAVVEREVDEWKARTGRNGENGAVEDTGSAKTTVNSTNSDGQMNGEVAEAAPQTGDTGKDEVVRNGPASDEVEREIDGPSEAVVDAEDGDHLQKHIGGADKAAVETEETSRSMHEQENDELPDADNDEDTAIY